MPTVQGNNPGNCPKFPLQSSKKEEAPPERGQRSSALLRSILTHCFRMHAGPRPEYSAAPASSENALRSRTTTQQARSRTVSLTAGKQGQNPGMRCGNVTFVLAIAC